jgi:hypothetical protein
MIVHPDDPREGDEAAQESAAASAAPAGRSAEVAEERVWVVPSIVLALVALSGSVLLFAVVLVVGVVLWMLSTPPLAPSGGGGDSSGYPPGRPFGWPGLLS